MLKRLIQTSQNKVFAHPSFEGFSRLSADVKALVCLHLKVSAADNSSIKGATASF